MTSVLEEISAELETIRAQNLWKTERPIVSPQSAYIRVASNEAPREVLNLCANNYLGLADSPQLIAAAKEALDSHGLGMASVRFICGTSDLHRELEHAIAELSRHGGCHPLCRLFRCQWRRVRAAVGEKDAIISDSLNHASIIDGIRLTKAIWYLHYLVRLHMYFFQDCFL